MHDIAPSSPRLLWQQGNSSDLTREYEYLGPEHEFPNSLKQPLQYFRLFFTDEFMQLLVYQSNLYSAQVNPNKFLNITTEELEQWLGIEIYFLISKLPNTRMHWSKQLGSFQSVVADVMSRNRWEEIKLKLHMVDNSTLDSNKPDNLFKVWPMVDHL